MKTKLSIINENPVALKQLVQYFGSLEEFEMRIITDNIQNYLELTENNKIIRNEIILINYKLQYELEIKLIQQLKELNPDLKIIIMSLYEVENIIFNAIKSGIACFLNTNVPLTLIRETIMMVAQNSSKITPALAREILYEPYGPTCYSLKDEQRSFLKTFVNRLGFPQIAHELNKSVHELYTSVFDLYSDIYMSCTALSKNKITN